MIDKTYLAKLLNNDTELAQYICDNTPHLGQHVYVVVDQAPSRKPQLTLCTITSTRYTTKRKTFSVEGTYENNWNGKSYYQANFSLSAIGKKVFFEHQLEDATASLSKLLSKL